MSARARKQRRGQPVLIYGASPGLARLLPADSDRLSASLLALLAEDARARGGGALRRCRCRVALGLSDLRGCPARGFKDTGRVALTTNADFDDWGWFVHGDPRVANIIVDHDDDDVDGDDANEAIWTVRAVVH
ncbi:hypothetical protein SPI_03983 [Niveomyces insectorum RCEF 264]|uniref:Uncharacterized protein n=1 Tax=Niveomyces insectorum RCEF 264 TaxID=1081102 RepID=A0A167VBU2_9HYPO|nr:hypothetical protein SPI_03983 [Niveomyces insectorum RCEF 264]